MQKLLPKPGHSCRFFISHCSCMTCCAVGFQGWPGPGGLLPGQPPHCQQGSSHKDLWREGGEAGLWAMYELELLPAGPTFCPEGYTHHPDCQQLQSLWGAGGVVVVVGIGLHSETLQSPGGDLPKRETLSPHSCTLSPTCREGQGL